MKQSGIIHSQLAVLDKENQYILGSRNGYNYLFTIQRRLKLLPDGTLGYGKWLKDW